MERGRAIPLFDQNSPLQSWNERMSAGEFAVLFANCRPTEIDAALGPVAVIFSSLNDAIGYAETETKKAPRLRCSIYDESGMGGPPVRVIAGARGADTSFLSSRFRLWAGSACLATGIALSAAEMLSGMTLTWAGLLAARIGPAGAILLLTEAGVRLSNRVKKQAR